MEFHNTGELFEDDCGKYRLVYVFPKYIKEYVVPEDADFTEQELKLGAMFFYRLFGKEWRSKSGYEIRVNAADFPSMAHLMHHLGTFKSVSDARRNGYAGPIEACVKMVRVNGSMHRVVID